MDAEIEQFFDTLDHQQLMAALRRRISDGEGLRLIYRWLKAGYLWEGSFHDTDQGSPQGGVLSPLLANVYLHCFDEALEQQTDFRGWLTRYADDFVIQCYTAKQAERALAWVQATLGRLGLRLHPEKTRVVNDREGFDFLGFHHRRVRLRGYGRESRGVLRWPSRQAQQRFRERVRQLVGPPQRLRQDWSACLVRLKRYLIGWLQYYRHGQGTRVLQKLDWYLVERIARNRARAQPTGKRRRRVHWIAYRERRSQWGQLPQLQHLRRGPFREDRGRAKVACPEGAPAV